MSNPDLTLLLSSDEQDLIDQLSIERLCDQYPEILCSIQCTNNSLLTKVYLSSERTLYLICNDLRSLDSLLAIAPEVQFFGWLIANAKEIAIYAKNTLIWLQPTIFHLESISIISALEISSMVAMIAESPTNENAALSAVESALQQSNLTKNESGFADIFPLEGVASALQYEGGNFVEELQAQGISITRLKQSNQVQMFLSGAELTKVIRIFMPKKLEEQAAQMIQSVVLTTEGISSSTESASSPAPTATKSRRTVARRPKVEPASSNETAPAETSANLPTRLRPGFAPVFRSNGKLNGGATISELMAKLGVTDAPTKHAILQNLIQDPKGVYGSKVLKAIKEAKKDGTKMEWEQLFAACTDAARKQLKGLKGSQSDAN